MKNIFDKIPGYILAYYGYELLYAIFWLIAPRVVENDMDPLYFLTMIIAVGWLGYMMFRLFVLHDKNVNALVLISNVLVLESISHQRF